MEKGLIILSAPSKTFLFGEYLALVGGPSAIINTGPFFKMPLKKEDLKKKDFNIKFIDPHHGQGGFGASTAQFLFDWVVIEYKKQDQKISFKDFCLNLFTEDWLSKLYKSYNHSNSLQNFGRYLPSGVDLLAQTVGGICFLKPSDSSEFSDKEYLRGKNSYKIKKQDWVFKKNYDFLILRTGNKEPTHEHLKKLDSIETSHFYCAALKITQSFEDKNWKDFCEGIAEYYNEMQRQDLVDPRSVELVEEWKSCKEVESIKACGALGSDTLLLFYKNKNSRKIYHFAQQMAKKINKDKKEDDLLTLSSKDLGEGFASLVRHNLK